MSFTARRLTPQGLAPVAYRASSLADATQHEPDGIYTTASTQERFQVLKLSQHLARLYDSAEREGIAFTLPVERIREGLRQLIEEAGYENTRFRITVPYTNPNEPILSAEPFAGHPAALYEKGIRVVTAKNSARHNPGAKDTAWMRDRRHIESQLPDEVYTAILLDGDGNLLEGTSSNFYAVLGGKLHTAQEGVLAGIAQQIVLEVAPRVLPVVREPVNIADLPHLQEAFITSSSRGVMPVVQIDQQVLGDGTPGKHTQDIQQAYLAWMLENAESL